ncbi:MAG: amidohydrolase family protein [bacterium]
MEVIAGQGRVRDGGHDRARDGSDVSCVLNSRLPPSTFRDMVTLPLRAAVWRLASCAFSVSVALLSPARGHAQTAHAPPALTDSLRLYYVGRPVGWERYSLTRDSAGWTHAADFDYVDRGRRIHLASSSVMAADYASRRLEVTRFNDTTRTLATRVVVDGQHASVLRNGVTADVDLPPDAFALSQYQPMSQHLALLRYWQGRGRPASVAVVPGGPTNRVAITRRGVDSVTANGVRVVLTRYTMDGIVWGTEYIWLDDQQRLALFASAGGGLSFKGVRAELVPMYPELMSMAARVAVADLARIAARTTPIASGTTALVGATLIDGTGGAAIPDATIVVAAGRVVAAGPSSAIKVPANARRMDVHGKTIIPGLWDSHAHLHQLEWVPVYLAAGVTSVRDMGNELPFVTALRAATNSGHVAGPHIYAAGLIDGDGPNAFGALSATTPEQGRAIVRQYHAVGFEQMKLYSLLSPAVVAAVCDEAHKLGMTVTGHIPNSLSLLAAVDSGMDQVAHLSVRGVPGSDSLRQTIEHLKARGTIIDPTVSWNEIGGHSTAEPLQSFQPVTQHLPTAFVQFRAAGWGAANVDTATAHARLARSLAIIKALHDGGVPIVAGTDEGVPGFSVYREMELYVKAGLSPMDALLAATSVPARALGVSKSVGTVAAGMRADLLVLDANPLDDISNVRRVKFVMHDGKMYESASLWRAIGFTP